MSELDRFDRIEKRLVHKHREENVCITPLRRELPRRLPGDALASPELQRAPQVARALLERCYVPRGAERVLTLVPQIVSEAELSEAVRTLPAAARQLIARGYLPDAGGPWRSLAPDVGEREELGLTEALRRQPFFRQAPLDERSRRQLAALVETMAGVEKPEVFWCQLVCDRSHAFFFEHSQEHVPGMLLIEACRQMVEAAWHQFGRAPFEDKFVMDTVQVSFHAYVELQPPLLMRLEPRARKSRTGTWEALEPVLEVYQRGVKLGSYGGRCRLVPSSCFSLLRESMIAATSLAAQVP